MHRANSPSPVLHSLVYGLLYPAILGAALVVLAREGLTTGGWAGLRDSPRLQTGLLLAVVFAVSYSRGSVRKPYPILLALFDSLEIALMTLALIWTGLIKPPATVEHLGWAQAALATVLGLQLLAAGLTSPLRWDEPKHWYRWGPRILVAGLLGASIWFSEHPAVHSVLSLVIGIIAIAYAVLDKRLGPTPAVTPAGPDCA